MIEKVNLYISSFFPPTLGSKRHLSLSQHYSQELIMRSSCWRLGTSLNPPLSFGKLVIAAWYFSRESRNWTQSHVKEKTLVLFIIAHLNFRVGVLMDPLDQNFTLVYRTCIGYNSQSYCIFFLIPVVTTPTHTDGTGSSLTPQVSGPVSFVGYQVCLRSCIQVLPKENKKQRDWWGWECTAVSPTCGRQRVRGPQLRSITRYMMSSRIAWATWVSRQQQN